MKKVYTYTLRVWLWPGSMPWHFVTLPKDLFTQLRSKLPKGMIKVKATLGKTSWDTSLFPHSKDGSFIMPIKKSVREKEGIFARDEVRVRIELI
jgi:hypothetical protein